MIIPSEIKNILAKLQGAGFEAYAVGGCVRDLLLGKKPKDWDVCTNALPEQIQAVFPDSFYENEFGTVGVKTGKNLSFEQSREDKFLEDSSRLASLRSNNKDVEIVEITTYRVDAKYSDKRHPDSVSFTRNLEDDLARRDFTINAIALQLTANSKQSTVIDPFNGQEDLKNGVIRAVGEPDKRFNEDALRMLRAVRFAVELCFTTGVEHVSQNNEKSHPESPAGGEGSKKDSSLRLRSVQNDKNGCRFAIEPKTKAAIKKNAGWLQAVSKERVRDELVKIIMSDRPDEGILLLSDLGLLEFVIPELTKGIGLAQNKHHIYSIFEHGIFSLKFAAHPSTTLRAGKNSNLVVRLAALLHDVAKPQAKRGEGPDATFYNHDIMGARATARILERLRFDKETIERVANLVRHHMFVYDVGAVTEAGVRRLLVRVGPENMADLIALRVADRLGSGVPKAQPYRLRHFQYMVDKVQHDPISVKMLKINGSDIMEILKIKPGPKIGAILDVLLAEVIEDPARNDKKLLAKRAKELSEVDLAQLRQLAKARIEEEKEEEDKVIKGKYWVQ